MTYDTLFICAFLHKLYFYGEFLDGFENIEDCEQAIERNGERNWQSGRNFFDSPSYRKVWGSGTQKNWDWGTTTGKGELYHMQPSTQYLYCYWAFAFLLQNALLQETTEEWEQCERKLRETQAWLEKTKQGLDTAAGKRKPLRDQLTARDKVLADVAVQRTKIGLAVEKLQASWWRTWTHFVRLGQ